MIKFYFFSGKNVLTIMFSVSSTGCCRTPRLLINYTSSQSVSHTSKSKVADIQWDKTMNYLCGPVTVACGILIIRRYQCSQQKKQKKGGILLFVHRKIILCTSIKGKQTLFSFRNPMKRKVLPLPVQLSVLVKLSAVLREPVVDYMIQQQLTRVQATPPFLQVISNHVTKCAIISYLLHKLSHWWKWSSASGLNTKRLIY